MFKRKGYAFGRKGKLWKILVIITMQGLTTRRMYKSLENACGRSAIGWVSQCRNTITGNGEWWGRFLALSIWCLKVKYCTLNYTLKRKICLIQICVLICIFIDCVQRRKRVYWVQHIGLNSKTQGIDNTQKRSNSQINKREIPKVILGKL